MGLTAWYFQRIRPGELRPLTRKAFHSFLGGKGQLLADDDGYVRYVKVIVYCEQRRPIVVRAVNFMRARALTDGSIDPKHHDEVLVAGIQSMLGDVTALEAQLDEVLGTKLGPPEGVVPAKHRFAQRRFEHLAHWDPEPADQQALRQLVNARAKTELL